MAQSTPSAVPMLGKYQLENLLRQQTKFLMVALVDDPTSIPVHPLLKTNFTFAPAEAAREIVTAVEQQQIPAWWPIILISENGKPDGEIATALAGHQLINVFSYRGGWSALLTET